MALFKIVLESIVYYVGILVRRIIWQGQKVYITKRNQIIPQVFEVEEIPIAEEAEFLFTPLFCPICGEPTSIEENEGVKILICGNPNCEGKMINKLNGAIIAPFYFL